MDLNRLAAALGASQSPGQASGQGSSGPLQYGRLAHALAQRRGMRPGDAKYAGLAALAPYGDQKYADRLSGHGATGLGVGSQGAFQNDSFQDDAYQVFL